ncbi:MAG: sigma-70 family RNA polymerase sigma factor [Dermatophilaceae bacterium]
MPLDEHAVAQIYREHAPMLRRLVTHATGDAQRAEDVVQEVILRLWRQAPAVENVRAYLAQSVRNLLIDQYRAAARRPIEAVPLDGIPAAPDPVAQIDRALDRVLVEEALARLSAEHRDVVRALHYERQTVAETAGRLGVPEGTVKSRAYYALRHLRVVLDEMGVTR